jgi:hypothetical protein
VVDAEPGASLASPAVLFSGRLTQSGWQVSRCALTRASRYLFTPATRCWRCSMQEGYSRCGTASVTGGQGAGRPSALILQQHTHTCNCAAFYFESVNISYTFKLFLTADRFYGWQAVRAAAFLQPFSNPKWGHPCRTCWTVLVAPVVEARGPGSAPDGPGGVVEDARPASGPADRVGGWRPEMRGSRAKGPGLAGTRTARESGPAGRDAGRSRPRRLLGGGRRGQGLAAQAA